MRRLFCLAFGHRWDADDYCCYCCECGHCGQFWDREYVFDQWVGVLPWIKSKLRRPMLGLTKTCDHCRKPVPFWRAGPAYGETFCSAKCREEWVPF